MTPARRQPLNSTLLALAALWVMVALASGCGDSNLAPARGLVRVSGRPACSGRVVFLPMGGGKPALGDIDQDGHFTLTTGDSADGAAIAVQHIVLKDVRCAGDAKGKNYRATESVRVEVRGGQEN